MSDPSTVQPIHSVPAPGCKLKCLICAHTKEWGVFDTVTGAAVCAECRDNARQSKQAVVTAALLRAADLLKGKPGDMWYCDRAQELVLSVILEEVWRRSNG
jgi:hypothetical protein